MKFYDAMGFYNKPADLPGMARAGVFFPGAVNDRRDAGTGELQNRVAGFWPADVDRIRDTLAQYPKGSLLIFNTEGIDAAPMIAEPERDPAANDVALRCQIAMLELIRRLRSDLKVAYNAIPSPLTGGDRKMWEIANPAAYHAEARRLAGEVRTKVLPLCAAGLAYQLYFLDRYGNLDFNFWGNYPPDPQALKFGWGHIVQAAALQAIALGVPAVALFNPGYVGTESGARQGQPMPDGELWTCLDWFRRYGMDVVLWGGVTQGQGRKSRDGLELDQWIEKAPWWQVVQAFAKANK